MTSHKNVYMALAAAQSEMGSAKKSAQNPHFRSKYADLSEVVEAVKPSLSKHGLAYFHTLESSEFGHVMRTILAHGESDTTIECPVPLILGKQDMQGFKSATTYAKRIGLESVTGIAPEDDDGNAAVAAAPRELSWAQTIIAELPEGATEKEKATAIADALKAQFKRKKTLGELSNEWDCRAKLIESLRERFSDLHSDVVDAYENRVIDVTPSEQTLA